MLLGIDIGTTSVKTVLCDNKGNIIFSTSANQNLYSKKPGWAEEDPKEWWENTKKTIKTCLKSTDIDSKDIKAIGVTGMVPALVLLDKNNNILRRSIQQNDARTVSELEILKERIDEKEFFRKTGGSINQQLIGPKIMWLKKHEPDVYNNISTIFGSYDYINFKLTGEKVVEHNWALESGLMNIKEKKWDDELLMSSYIDGDSLPDIVESQKIIGEVSKEAARETNLTQGIPVVGGIADHVSSAFAAGLTSEGDLNIKIGGAGDILFSLDELVIDKRLFIDYHAIPDMFMINGCMAASGSLIKWFKNKFCQFENEVKPGGDEQEVFNYLNNKAEEIPAGSEGLVILPYFLGEKTPIHNPKAKGVIFGLGLHHKKYHIYRALMEAVAFGFKHHKEILEELGLKTKK